MPESLPKTGWAGVVSRALLEMQQISNQARYFHYQVVTDYIDFAWAWLGRKDRVPRWRATVPASLAGGRALFEKGPQVAFFFAKLPPLPLLSFI